MHAIPAPDHLRPGRLTHLDPYAYPFDVVDGAARDLLPWLVTEDAPSCYRYVLANPRTRTRQVGLVAAWVGGPGPCAVVLEELDVEEVASDQGRPLGNVRDAAGILHRLEAYDGPARLELMLALVRDALAHAHAHPLPWAPAHPARAQVVWITSGPAWVRPGPDTGAPDTAEPILVPARWMLYRIDPPAD